MTTIRMTCSYCSEGVEMEVRKIKLEKSSKDAKEGRYRFKCPLCGTEQTRPASKRVVAVLEATEVEIEIVATAGPITEEEITEFVAGLDDFDGQGGEFEIVEE